MAGFTWSTLSASSCSRHSNTSRDLETASTCSRDHMVSLTFTPSNFTVGGGFAPIRRARISRLPAGGCSRCRASRGHSASRRGEEPAEGHLPRGDRGDDDGHTVTSCWRIGYRCADPAALVDGWKNPSARVTSPLRFVRRRRCRLLAYVSTRTRSSRQPYRLCTSPLRRGPPTRMGGPRSCRRARQAPVRGVRGPSCWRS